LTTSSNWSNNITKTFW